MVEIAEAVELQGVGKMIVPYIVFTLLLYFMGLLTGYNHRAKIEKMIKLSDKKKLTFRKAIDIINA